jgi:hypothetical protein
MAENSGVKAGIGVFVLLYLVLLAWFLRMIYAL